MRNSLIRLIVLAAMVLLCPWYAVADADAVQHRLVFRSGRVVVGEIVFRNEDVVIIKDSYGTRFQYPLSDLTDITELTDEQPSQDTLQDDKLSRQMTNVKRTSLGVRLAGGVVGIDGESGAAVAADVLLGANNIAGRRIFIGGQVGYRALMYGGKTLSVIPIDAVMELPLITGVHSPMLGANIGYGIGIGGMRGGVNAGLTLAYRYHFSRTGSLHVGIGAEVQQLASAFHTIEIEPGQVFASNNARTAVMGMMTLGILF